MMILSGLLKFTTEELLTCTLVFRWLRSRNNDLSWTNPVGLERYTHFRPCLYLICNEMFRCILFVDQVKKKFLVPVQNVPIISCFFFYFHFCYEYYKLYQTLGSRLFPNDLIACVVWKHHSFSFNNWKTFWKGLIVWDTILGERPQNNIRQSV